MRRTLDGRKLDAFTQAHIRRLVVVAVRGGMTQGEAAHQYHVSLRAVNAWVARNKVGGLRALKPKPQGRPRGSGRLTAHQAARTRRIVLGKLPNQLKLPFYLWTRVPVRQLIVQRYDVRLSLTSVGRYLKAWGLSAQKPARRAYERNEEAITRWLQEDYPAIARQAKRAKATIYWGDEMGVRSDHVTGKRYAPVGQTPVIHTTGQRFGGNMISALTNKGALAFMVFTGKFIAARFVAFLRRLLKQANGSVYLIVDGHPVHRSSLVKEFVTRQGKRLRLILLPGYCPELNPDELLNQDVKTNAVGKSRPRHKMELLDTIHRYLHRRQKQPEVIRNLFQERHVCYAA